MATRSKKGSTKSSTTRKRTTKSAKLAEEMQTVGADIVPSVTVTVEGSHRGERPAAEAAAAPPRNDDVPQALPVPEIETRSTNNRQPAADSRERGEQFDEWDFHLFNEGTHTRLWEKLGAHITKRDG